MRQQSNGLTSLCPQICYSGLCRLLNTRDDRLNKLGVQGDPIVDMTSNKRRTRSQGDDLKVGLHSTLALASLPLAHCFAVCLTLCACAVHHDAGFDQDRPGAGARVADPRYDLL